MSLEVLQVEEEMVVGLVGLTFSRLGKWFLLRESSCKFRTITFQRAKKIDETGRQSYKLLIPLSLERIKK